MSTKEKKWSMKKWTKREINYLYKKAGTLTTYEMAKNLRRSKRSVNWKLNHLEIGSFYENMDGVTISDLSRELHINRSRIKDDFCEKRGLPYKKRKLYKNKFVYIINLDDFWDWAYENQEILSFHMMDENAFGKKPDWVLEKRKNDLELAKKSIQHKDTKVLRQKIIAEARCQKLTREEIAEKYDVTVPYIYKVLSHDKSIPLPITEKRGRNLWTDEMEAELENLLKESKRLIEIMSIMGKTKSSIQTKLKKMYGTVSVKEIQKMLTTSQLNVK